MVSGQVEPRIFCEVKSNRLNEISLFCLWKPPRESNTIFFLKDELKLASLPLLFVGFRFAFPSNSHQFSLAPGLLLAFLALSSQYDKDFHIICSYSGHITSDARNWGDWHRTGVHLMVVTMINKGQEVTRNKNKEGNTHLGILSP